MTLEAAVSQAVGRHPAVRTIDLVGSRAGGRATELSDWDFRVETEDFDAVAHALPDLVADLDPLARQWDRLSREWCYMLILRGPVKVDLIFPDHPHTAERPWAPTAENLPALDAHFWDWMLWLHPKEAVGKRELVEQELEKLAAHLLGPLGSPGTPTSVADAVARYRAAREGAERELQIHVPRDLEGAVAGRVTGE